MSIAGQMVDLLGLDIADQAGQVRTVVEIACAQRDAAGQVTGILRPFLLAAEAKKLISSQFPEELGKMTSHKPSYTGHEDSHRISFLTSERGLENLIRTWR